MRTYYIAAIILAFFQPQLGGIFLPVIPVVLAATKIEVESQVFIFAFLVGLLADLIGGTTLGTASLFLLLCVVLVQGLGGAFRKSAKLTVGAGVILGILFQVVIRGWLH